MIYFDTSYLARMYLEDRGWEKVRALAATDQLACCLHGRAELVSSFHRKFREGVFNRRELADLLNLFENECANEAFRWLPLSLSVVARLTKIYAALPHTAPLRAADGLHLACAAENGFKKIYSNDERLLAAAVHFGLAGENVI